VADEIEVESDETEPYRHAWEHVREELRLLDLLLRRAVHERGLARAPEGAPGWGPSVSRVLAALGRPPAGIELSEAIHRLHIRIAKRRAAAAGRGEPVLFDLLAARFDLGLLEQRCMIFAAAPEIARNYGSAFALLNEDPSQRWLTVGLFLDLLCVDEDHRPGALQRLRPEWPLCRDRLIEVGDRDVRHHTALRIDAGALRLMLGHRGVDPRIARSAWVGVGPRAHEEVDVDDALERRLSRVVGEWRAAAERRELFVHLHGADGVGRRRLVEAACERNDLALVRCDLATLLDGDGQFDQLIALVAREAMLQPAALCFEGFDRLLARDDAGAAGHLSAMIDALRRYALLTFLVGRRAWTPHELLRGAGMLSVPVDLPEPARAHRIWDDELSEFGWALDDGEVETLVRRFQLSPGQIRDAVQDAVVEHSWGDSAERLRAIQRGAHRQATHALETFATRVVPRFGLGDVVLPRELKSHLEEIVGYAHNRGRVLQEWGFGRKLSLGKGLIALLAGPSGTGKTMAAEAIAGELDLELFKLNLGLCLSPLVGEFEERMERVLSEAARAPVVLMLDEFDALGARRGAVKEARDRYASLEAAYLLQRLEEHEGVIILATNLLKNVDEAFVRRIHVRVEFALPRAEERRAIWLTNLPTSAPTDGVDIDWLADQFELSGASIRNASVHAAFAAAAAGTSITMESAIRGVAAEFRKTGRLLKSKDFGEYFSLVDD
jgi:hypothetical protein